MPNKWYNAMQDAQKRLRKRRGIPEPTVTTRTTQTKFNGAWNTQTSSSTQEHPHPDDPNLAKIFRVLENQQRRLGKLKAGQIPLEALKTMALECMEAVVG